MDKIFCRPEANQTFYRGGVLLYEEGKGRWQMPQELLREMVEQHGNSIYRLALRYTGDRFLAEDIAQETFYAPAPAAKLRPSRPVGPWLFRIALNLCCNRRRAAREIPVEERVAAEADPGRGRNIFTCSKKQSRSWPGRCGSAPIYRVLIRST